jgi:hypothetical protein
MNLQDATIAELANYQARLEERGAELKADIAEYGAELDRRFGATAKTALARAGKAHGTLTEILTEAPGFRLKHTTRMTVQWDNDKLLAWAQNEPWVNVEHYCRTKIEVKESVFKAMSPEDRNLPIFREARTEKLGATSYELLPPNNT